jgi:FtsH-binding integral membrane protein
MSPSGYESTARRTAGGGLGARFDQGLRQHMLRVYNYMALGLVLTGAVAFMVSSVPALQVPIFATPLKWVAMLAPLPFMLLLSFGIQAMPATTIQAVFWAFCAVMGLCVASVFLVFTGISIARTFFMAGAMFGATSCYGYTTRTDLTKISSLLTVALIGVIVACLVDIFIGSSVLQFVVSVGGIFVFLSLAAWDTQSIKEQYVEELDAASKQKLAVSGALSLYVNSVNIFELLLCLTGQREE